MTDEEILDQIHDLVAQERKLREERASQQLSQDQEQEQVRRLEVALDQCWDLLRQRRAREEFGEDPSLAQVRPPGEVEGYIG